MSPMKRPELLIVDDNVANLLTLRAVLESGDYNIVEAHSGVETIELCQNREFALILLDVHMPGLDGYETARRIKKTQNQDTPIIFITAIYKDDPAVKKGFEVGAVDYFGKPFDPDILKTKIKIYTELFQKTKRLQETEKLLATHSQIKTLLEAIPVGVIIADAEGRIHEYNEEAKRIWGGILEVSLNEYGEFKGYWADTGKRIEAHDWALARALEKGQSSKEELIDIETFDGKKKTISNSAHPVRGKNGQILGAVAVIQDLTERNEILHDIQKKAKEILEDIQKTH